LVENFFATLECELFDRRKWETKAEVCLVMFAYIEGRYRLRRCHRTFGPIMPANRERRHLDSADALSKRDRCGMSAVGA